MKGDKVYAISSKRVKRLKNVNPEVVKKAVSEIVDSIAVKRGINPDEIKDFDGGYAFVYQGKEYRFRVNVARYDNGNYFLITMRWLKEHKWSISDYFLTPLSIKPLMRKINANMGGLYLVIGPTGSGKSTLTAAVIKEVLKKPFNVITLEDPIEYRLHSEVGEITQREVGIDTPTFYRGLKSAMRENPNVIFVGEVRDEETVEALAQAADTGHVVIATLHTESPKDTLERLQGLVRPERMDSVMKVVAKTLIGVLGIRMYDAPSGGKIILHEYLNAEDPTIKSLLFKRNYSQITSYQNSLEKGNLTFSLSAAYQMEFKLTKFTESDYLSTGLFDKEELHTALKQVRLHKKLLES